MAKIITFSNQKGGSGKTTLSVNLAVLWSNSQYKVAVIDADPQKSLDNWVEARKKYYGENEIGIDGVKKLLINPIKHGKKSFKR